MKPVRIFRHVAHEGPGYLATFLDRHAIPWELVKIDRGAPVATDLDQVSGLVFMGGPMSVNDDLPWIAPELALIREAVERDLPVLGHCLGGQLISKALGGRIESNGVKEIGWLDVSKVAGPAADDWLEGLPSRFELFHWHGERFTIPEGAERILESDHCPNQAFVIGNTLAMQCHVEMTTELVPLWADENAGEIATPGPTVQSKAQMTERLEARVEALQKIADRLYERWLRGAGEAG